MTGFKIFSFERGFLVSPIIGNTTLLSQKIIHPKIKLDEIDYRCEEFRGKTSSGNIGWCCFDSFANASKFLNSFFYFKLENFGAFKIFKCDCDEIYTKKEFDFQTSGFTCRYITLLERVD